MITGDIIHYMKKRITITVWGDSDKGYSQILDQFEIRRDEDQEVLLATHVSSTNAVSDPPGILAENVCEAFDQLSLAIESTHGNLLPEEESDAENNPVAGPDAVVLRTSSHEPDPRD